MMFLVRSWMPLMSAEKWTFDEGGFEAWFSRVLSSAALGEPVLWEDGFVDMTIGEVEMVEIVKFCDE